MGLLAKDSIAEIEKKELKLLREERDILEEIHQLTQAMTKGERELEEYIKKNKYNWEKGARLNLADIDFFKTQVLYIMGYLEHIKDKMGKHFHEGELIKSVTEWRTIFKILNDRNEIRKVNIIKFIAQIEKDLKGMFDEIKYILNLLSKRAGQLDTLIRETKTASKNL